VLIAPSQSPARWRPDTTIGRRWPRGVPGQQTHPATSCYHENAIAATDYGDLVAVRKRMIGLPDHKSQDTANVASALGGEAYALLLAHRPADAVAASQEALTFDPTQLFIRTNLAHGFADRHYDDAMRIYRTYWTKRLGQQTFGQAVLQDFRDLATAGGTDRCWPRQPTRSAESSPVPRARPWDLQRPFSMQDEPVGVFGQRFGAEGTSSDWIAAVSPPRAAR